MSKSSFSPLKIHNSNSLERKKFLPTSKSPVKLLLPDSKSVKRKISSLETNEIKTVR